MNFDLSDDQKMLAEQASKLLAEVSTPDRLRQLIDDRADYDALLWQNLAELGFLGAAIPEEFGGIGMSAMELSVIAQELGRQNAALPFISSVVQAAKIIELAGSQAQKEAWLPRIASGEIIATMATNEGTSEILTPPVPRCQLDSLGLSGEKAPVADGHYAQLAIVSCQHEGKMALALVDLTQSSIAKAPLKSFDELRPFAKLTFDQAQAELLPCEDLDSRQALEKALNYAAAITAFEQIGGAEACLFMARDYAMIGRFLDASSAVIRRLNTSWPRSL